MARLNEMIGFIPINNALMSWKINRSLDTAPQESFCQPLLPQPRDQPLIPPELLRQLTLTARTPHDSSRALRKSYVGIIKSFDRVRYETTGRLKSDFKPSSSCIG